MHSNQITYWGNKTTTVHENMGNRQINLFEPSKKW